MKLLLAAALLSLSAPAGAAAPVPAPPVLPGQEIEVKAQDGWTLKGVYAPSQPGKLTLVLVHGRGQRKESWIRLAKSLKAGGYGYLALDMRGHGLSQTAPDGQPLPWRKFKATKAENDFANMTLDIQAAVAFLTEGTVSEDTIGLIGEDLGSSIALKYAAVHPRVQLLVMVSPGLSYQEVLTVNAIRAYKDRPILMIYSELDKNAARATPILYDFARRSAGERNATLVSVPNVHGNRLLDGARSRQIVAWLDDPLKPEDPPESSTEGAAGGDGSQLGQDSGEEPSPEDSR